MKRLRTIKSKLQRPSRYEPPQPVRQVDADAQLAWRIQEDERMEAERRRVAEEQEQEKRRREAWEERQRQEEEQRRQAAEHAERVRRAQAAEQERRELQRRQNAGAANIAHLRELIRQRYGMDLWIWSQRDIGRIQKASRPMILQHCKRADDLLQQIYRIVEGWEEDLFDGPEEWGVANTIKRLLLRKDQHVIWCESPPWEFKGDGSGKDVVRRPVPRTSNVPRVELG